ncbi:MAG TPA: hypothetical protein VNM39_13305 [Verrucomicrobiae bacterium]|nr:hypothetical protein [Verrucomicrobiae bacterium]
MKKSTERFLIGGIIISGLVALFTSGKALGSSGPSMPASFHPELTPLERQFVWSEVQNNTADSMLARASIYDSTILADGSKLSPAALQALAAEAAAKALADKTGFRP